jgi:uncharacterized protein (TIGR04255 family)
MMDLEKLPLKLNKEPLIDAVFEVRFSSTFPASNILPGVLFSKLEGTKTIEPLPAAQLPKSMRDTDPNLQFAPVSRLAWDRFLINISDRSVSVGCKLPYPGWNIFKPAIIDVISILSDIGIVQSVERYALRYVDLIPSSNLEQYISIINLDIAIANHKLNKEVFQVLMEIPRDGFVNAVRIISSAVATLANGLTKEGIVVDIDTMVNLNSEPLQVLLDSFSKKLDAIHKTNKTIFFDCLKQETIDALEPTYECN